MSVIVNLVFSGFREVRWVEVGGLRIRDFAGIKLSLLITPQKSFLVVDSLTPWPDLPKSSLSSAREPGIDFVVNDESCEERLHFLKRCLLARIEDKMDTPSLLAEMQLRVDERWKRAGGALVSDLDGALFLFDFSSPSEASRILLEKEWVVNGARLLLDFWNPLGRGRVVATERRRVQSSNAGRQRVHQRVRRVEVNNRSSMQSDVIAELGLLRRRAQVSTEQEEGWGRRVRAGMGRPTKGRSLLWEGDEQRSVMDMRRDEAEAMGVVDRNLSLCTWFLYLANREEVGVEATAGFEAQH
ncbi:hypothetical protein RJ640_017208 [Escallonia rubra]|uniref:DUF4283 domain-containing protein n=1 Tax=Escallonia rubra TaxID=112253 RepID=A0AA88RJK1_9ASTE|nr:hypothetical protein RJ640_017208 [Escallonia rubra]